jgi:glycosyltransferase involved in cell wall biosynthesis
VGGIPSAVIDGKNGYTFPLEGCTEKFCDCIERLMSSKQAYDQLAWSSFREYSERLNWGSSGRKIYALIQEFCNFPGDEPYRFSLSCEDAVELELDNTTVSRF